MKPINCSVGGCLRVPFRAGWCEAHYKRQRKGKEMGPLRIRRPNGPRRSVGTVRADLLARLDASAKARHLSRIMLVEAILERHFAREAE